ncbi:hypothetical protein BJ912DRAFT_436191 [Pholiota molesta]|nr:hypothetical protein BJ912DRAFT_436191 [Pholiota molesta]
MTFWDTSFASISEKATHTLRHLSLNHHFEIIDTFSSSNLDITSQTPGGPEISGISFRTMERLHNLKHLQHFSCDVTLPPYLNDQDLKKVLTWWPDLQHFELGSSLLPDEFEAVKSSHMTLACLSFFSNQVPKLKSLILPLVINDPLPLTPDVAPITKYCDLQSLTITRLETSEPAEFARYLHRLFPFLRNLESPCDIVRYGPTL